MNKKRKASKVKKKRNLRITSLKRKHLLSHYARKFNETQLGRSGRRKITSRIIAIN